MKVKQIMSADELVFAMPKDTIESVAKLLLANELGSVPVVESRQTRRVVGIITDRDIVVSVVAAGKDPRKSIVEQFMTHDPATLRPGDDAERAGTLMRENRVRRVPVVDERGSLVGIVSQTDLAEKVPLEPVSEPGFPTPEKKAA